MSKKLFTAVAASAALIGTPVLAQSVASDRAAAFVDEVEAQDDEGGNSAGKLFALIGGALIVAGIVIAVSGGDDEDLPTSP